MELNDTFINLLPRSSILKCNTIERENNIAIQRVIFSIERSWVRNEGLTRAFELERLGKKLFFPYPLTGTEIPFEIETTFLDELCKKSLKDVASFAIWSVSPKSII